MMLLIISSTALIHPQSKGHMLGRGLGAPCLDPLRYSMKST